MLPDYISFLKAKMPPIQSGGIFVSGIVENGQTVSTQISDADFDQAILQAHAPIVVSFTSDNKSCRALEPKLNTLADALSGRIRIARIDLDANPQLAARYAVISTPALVYFRDGKAIDRKIGVQIDSTDLKTWLERLGIGCACHPD